MLITFYIHENAELEPDAPGKKKAASS